VCLINLDRSPRRLAEFAHTNAHVTEVTRFSEVDGNALDRASIMRAGLVTSDLLSALGCAISHVALWKRGIAAGQMIRIAEDDAILHGGLRQHAAQVLANFKSRSCDRIR
jgi:GR25 family glycosyltransferase involved in LPS biosynthesis